MAGSMFEEYLTGGASELYGAHFTSADDRVRAVRVATRPLDSAVARALTIQQQRLAPSGPREESLEALRRGAAAVVTGQQVGLFLGPLYTVYKAASAIRWARALSEESGAPVVPIFWLQTVDHDLAEIAHCHLPGPHGVPLRLEVPVPADNRIPVAHCVLPAEVAGCLRELEAVLGHLPHAADHLASLARHYQPGRSWSDAFVGVIAELFSDTGLVFVDPRDPALASIAAGVHAKALERAHELAESLLERVRLLASRGWSAPLHVRADAPLSFFHPDGATGPRYRLQPASGGFAEIGGSGVHSLESLRSALEADPLRFSTSAILRPILQDTLLPTAAYVGGPSEVAYFAQLAPLYASYGLPMPLVIPRARFRIVDDRAERLLEKLGLSLEDVGLPEAELLMRRQRGRERALSPETVEAGLKERLSSALDVALGAVPLESLELERAAAKLRYHVARSAERFRRKYERRLLLEHSDDAEVLRRIEALLLPGGAPQERIYGISHYAARHGARRFIERVLEAATPGEVRQKDLRP